MEFETPTLEQIQQSWMASCRGPEIERPSCFDRPGFRIRVMSQEFPDAVYAFRQYKGCPHWASIGANAFVRPCRWQADTVEFVLRLPMEMQMKKCTVCGTEKDESLFVKDSRRKDGLGSRCKHCEMIRSRKNRPLVLGYPSKHNTSRRQALIARYGIDTVEAMECMVNE